MEKVLGVVISVVCVILVVGIASATFTAQVSANAGNINLFQSSYSSKDVVNKQMFNNTSTTHNELTSTSGVLTIGQSALQKTVNTVDGIADSTLLVATGAANAFDGASLLNSASSVDKTCDPEDGITSEKKVNGVVGVMGAGDGDNVLSYSANTKVGGTSENIIGTAKMPHDSDLLYGRMTSDEITNLSRNSNMITVMVQGNASLYANNSSTAVIKLDDD
jgi:hypothetical protein